MVVSEAMSRGLPVIATTHTGASDLIDHGSSGFVIPAGDEFALATQMRWCVENRHRLREISESAMRVAAQWQWKDYRNELASRIERRLDGARANGIPSEAALFGNRHN
jgi:glycosyltransferase involved in cell wall biosynthesis